MIALGIVLLLVGLLAGIGLLTFIGLVLILVGGVLWLMGAARTGGRRWY